MTKEMEHLIDKARNGSSASQLELGIGFMNGRLPSGTALSQDFHEARHWLHCAHENGVSTASLLLGTLHENGSGGAKDLRLALSYYMHATKRGDVIPMVRLARIYSAPGTEVFDAKSAAFWYAEVVRTGISGIDEVEIEEARSYLSHQRAETADQGGS